MQHCLDHPALHAHIVDCCEHMHPEHAIHILQVIRHDRNRGAIPQCCYHEATRFLAD